MKASEKWKSDLQGWAIPKEIIDQAPENPWIHPPVMFQIPDVIEDSISHQRAREVLNSGDSLLELPAGSIRENLAFATADVSLYSPLKAQR